MLPILVGIFLLTFCFCCATAVISLIHVQPPEWSTKETIKTVQMSQLLFLPRTPHPHPPCYTLFINTIGLLLTSSYHTQGRALQITVWRGLCKCNLLVRLWHGPKNIGKRRKGKLQSTAQCLGRTQQKGIWAVSMDPPNETLSRILYFHLVNSVKKIVSIHIFVFVFSLMFQ